MPKSDEKKAALDELTALSQEFGGYEELSGFDPEEILVSIDDLDDDIEPELSPIEAIVSSRDLRCVDLKRHVSRCGCTGAGREPL